jgi:hypothetical protein
MTERIAIGVLAFSLILSSIAVSEVTVRRGRDEGTMNIPASNVIGSGNITLYAAGLGAYGSAGGRISPLFGIYAGIADMIELSGQTSVNNYLEWGTSEAHLRLTTPGNDHLRFFGCAVQGDLYLTTAADSLSGSSAPGKPNYNSYMLPSIIMDFDWLAKSKLFPLKHYFSIGLVDDPDLLPRYSQIAIKTGVEWKLYQHSGFCDIGLGLYKEIRHGVFAGDPSYRQRVVWFEPGMRYRLNGKYSILASFRVAAFRTVNANNPLPTTLVRGGAAFEFPVLFKETNTEAIRSLVFMEQEKARKKDAVSQDIAQGKRAGGSGLDQKLKELNIKEDVPDSDLKKEELKKREEIQEKMKNIEKLLQQDQQEKPDSSSTP